jgi:phospholipase C
MTVRRERVLSSIVAFLLLVSPMPAWALQRPERATPFSHVIIVVQENHSFDNYFGTYPTANGTLLDNITSKLTPVDGLPNHMCLQYYGSCIPPHLTNSPNPENPVEGQDVYENDYGPGSNFATSSGPQSMVYFDYHSIAGYWDYAEEYGLADNYFAPVLSQTTPNRLMLLSGDTPVSTNYGPPPYWPYNRTILAQLDRASVSWGYYDLLNATADPATFYPLNYISGLKSANRSVLNIPSLISELSAGTGLPSVAFVNFLGDLRLTEHPPFSPSSGEAVVVSIVDALMRSKYWSSTVVFVTWDEGGGFYDHVVPPSDFTVNHGFDRQLRGLGQRVPLLVISPYSRLNYVSHAQLSHLSLLGFIEYNWNLPSLNNLVARANLPMDFFDFSLSPRPGVLIGSGVSYPLPLQHVSKQAEFGGSNLVQAALTVVVLAVAGVVLYSWSRFHHHLAGGRKQ